MHTKESLSEDSLRLAASFLPPQLRREYILNPDRAPGIPIDESHAALLWIDICNFSPLANRLIEDRERGVERLSQLLKRHYDPILDLVHGMGGEPMLFAGDGVMVGWPCDADGLSDAVRLAARCAQNILDLEDVTDDQGNPLMLHLAVSCGPCRLCEIGGVEQRWLVMFTGNAFDDLRAAVRNRAPGQVILSSSAIRHLPKETVTERIDHDAAILLEIIEAGHGQTITADLPAGNMRNNMWEYLPPPVHDRLDSGHFEWINELRPVSVIFVQLPGIESGTQSAVDDLQRAARIAIPVVKKYEGICGQLWIDEKSANFLIYFGPPPAAHHDDPERAVHAAMALLEAFEDNGFRCGIGVTSGKAFCGILGNDLFRQYTVLSDAVIVAARLAGIQDRKIGCDAETYKNTRQAFDFLPPEKVKIKGRGDEISVWVPERPATRPVGDVSELPSTGRQQEFEQLITALHASMAGGKACMIIDGQDGMGKSRLVSDFRRHAEKLGHEIMTTSGNRVEKEVPYRTWEAILSTLFGLGSGPDTETKRNILFDALPPQFAEQAALLNVVLPLDIPESDTVRSLSGQQRIEATKNLLLAIITNAASTQPLIIVIDDAQWMDEASWQLAAEIFKAARSCFLLITTTDLDSIPEANTLTGAGASVVRLEPLSDQAQDTLMRSVLGVDEIPDELMQSVRAIARGNPFFCIELARSLVEDQLVTIKDGTCSMASGITTDAIPLPETIQGAVRRRIDRLAPGPELALKVASVAGSRFATEHVRSIYPVQRERIQVATHLEADSETGLLFDDLVDNIEGYAFNNTITRDVAYEMLLFEQRQRLHRQSAQWYEDTFPHHLAPFYARLADHWEKGGEPTKAAGYYEKEAIRLFSAGYAKQSVEIGLRGVALLGITLPRAPAEIGPAIGQNMGAIGAMMGERKPADLLDLKPNEDPNVERLIWMLLRIGPFAFQSQQIELFALISVTCLRLTLEHGNGPPSADVYSMFSPIYRGMTGDRLGAYAWSQLALDLDTRNGNPLHARVAFVHTWFHHHWINPLHQHLPMAMKAARAGFDSGDILFACFNLSGYVIYQAACGAPLQEVMATAREHLTLNGKRVMNAAFHLIHEMQYAKALAGETEQPMSMTDSEYDEQRDIASICQTELGNQIGYYLVSRVKLHTHFGDWQGALEWAERVQPLLPAFAGQVADFELVQYHGLALLTGAAKTTGESAAQYLQDAREAADKLKEWAQTSPVNFLHKAQLLDATHMGLTGDGEGAMALFDEAARHAEEGGFLHDLGLIHEYRTMIRHLAGQELASLPAALDAYERWGAHAKIGYLKQMYSGN